jgi:hypothetical protein
MRRTQIILEDWQYENLKTISQEKGKSLSAVIREMVTTCIEEDTPRGTLDSICALGEDATGSGKDHDKLIYGNGNHSNG